MSIEPLRYSGTSNENHFLTMAKKMKNSYSINFSQIWLLIFPLLSLITGQSDVENYSPLSDVTDKVFGSPINGTAAAFGDFNSDQHIDIFFIVNEGLGVQVYLTHSGIIKSQAVINRVNETITSVVPGDYDGDSDMDVLITTKPNGKALDKTTPTSAFVYWGTSLDENSVTEVSTNMLDQPLVMDYNADMIPDFFGAEMDGNRYFWTYNASTSQLSFKTIAITGEHSTDQMRIPNSHAFLDLLDDDLAADLFVTSQAEGSLQFEVWQMQESNNEEQQWQFQKMLGLPIGEWAHVGQSSFTDIDADGHLDHILPVCEDAECAKSQIHAYLSKKSMWVKLVDSTDLIFDSQQWGFVPPTQQLSNLIDIPMTLRAGDVNLDNFPDFVCILQQITEGEKERALVVFQNSGGNSFEPEWPSDEVRKIKGPVLASLIDLTNTGLLDIIVVSQPNPDSLPQTYLLENQFSIDAYFVTVQVLSGFECPPKGSCPNGRYTYGVNQPGPQIHYDTTSSNGGRQRSMAAQLPQSSYLALQLPHAVMGLGQNPNFVDYLSVGIPSPKSADGKNKRIRTFTSIIPNSQLIVIPKPLDNSGDWTSKLLITPGQSVILTGCILVGTCVFIAAIAAILHFKEKREDEIEKRQEAHRFHFDAM